MPAIALHQRQVLVRCESVNQAKYLQDISRSFSKQTRRRRLTRRTKKEQCSLYVLEEKAMFRTFVEEAAALASIVLFVGMIAIWAQLIPQL
jgi:hypothetical protein